tara:strand:- start:2951 stop:3841 length:891 start_codon:yes stop_codon:yes gene_type:complete
MFSIGKKNERNKGNPVAKINGGEFGGKFLYMKPFKKDISMLPKKITERYTDEEYDILDNAIKTGFEPNDERAKEEYYKILNDFEAVKHKGFILKSGKLSPVLNFDKQERFYITGSSGSGKTYYATQLVKQYLSHYKLDNHDFVMISGVPASEDLQDLEPTVINPYELINEPLQEHEIKNAIVLFDDVLSIPKKDVKNNITAIVNNLVETNRHSNTTMLIINHLINNHFETRKLLNEASAIVFFPKSSAKNNIRKYLKQHEGFSDKLIRKIINLPSRSVTLYKNPEYILYEKGIFSI